MRVTESAMGGRWGTVLEVIDLRKTARTASERINAESSRNPYLYVVQWDNGNIERRRAVPRTLWFAGDDPGFGRPILRDPGRSK